MAGFLFSIAGMLVGSYLPKYLKLEMKPKSEM